MRSINLFIIALVTLLLFSASVVEAKTKPKTAVTQVKQAEPKAETPVKQLINIAYLSQEQPVPPSLSNLDPFIADKGLLGSVLAINDNNTTGQFTGQSFVLNKFIVPIDGNVVEVFNNRRITERRGVLNFIVTQGAKSR